MLRMAMMLNADLDQEVCCMLGGKCHPDDNDSFSSMQRSSAHMQY